jgi:signal transduction histidine kinase
MAVNLEAWWRRAGKALALVGLAVLGLVDVVTGHIKVLADELGIVIGLAQVAFVVVIAGVWLTARRQGPQRLAVAALAVAIWSLVTTLGHVFIVRGASLMDLSAGWSSASSWGLAESAALLGVVFALARWARPIMAVLGVTVTGFALAVLPLRLGGNDTLVIVGMGYALLAAGAAGVGMYFRLAALARDRQLATVRAEQRAEFARDLHDFIAHHVTGIVVQAQGARYVADADPRRAVEALEQIEQAGLQTMTAMRRMVSVLRGPADAPTAPLAVLTDVPALVEGFTAAGPVTAHLHIEGDISDLPVDVSSSAYRVVMEALTNVRQHARGAQRVDVSIGRTREWLFVRVTGLTRPGFGLAGLTERVTALGGRLRAEPAIPGGWVVDAALPVSPAAKP